jgi:hypothetical protein
VPPSSAIEEVIKDARGFTSICVRRDWKGTVLNALDFAETRNLEDAKLLGTARGKKKGERLTESEARALRRKVGGTASEHPSAHKGCH